MRKNIGSPLLVRAAERKALYLAVAGLLTALTALLPALLATLAWPVLAALLLAGLLLPTPALLLVALRGVLPWIVRHWTFSSHIGGFGFGPPRADR